MLPGKLGWNEAKKAFFQLQDTSLSECIMDLHEDGFLLKLFQIAPKSWFNSKSSQYGQLENNSKTLPEHSHQSLQTGVAGSLWIGSTLPVKPLKAQTPQEDNEWFILLITVPPISWVNQTAHITAQNLCFLDHKLEIDPSNVHLFWDLTKPQFSMTKLTL